MSSAKEPVDSCGHGTDSEFRASKLSGIGNDETVLFAEANEAFTSTEKFDVSLIGSDSVSSSHEKWYCDACGLLSNRKSRQVMGQIIWASCCTCSALVLLIFFLVILPIIIQSIVNKSQITIVDANIYNPTSKSFLSSFTFTTNQNLNTEVSIDIGTTTISWSGSSGYTGGNCLSISDSNSINLVSGNNALQGTALVLDTTAMSNLVSYSVNAESVTLQTSGTSTIKAIVQTDVSVAKKLSLNGFGGFTVPPIVTSVNVSNGTPMVLTAYVSVYFTSKSILTLHFGQNLYFNMFYEGVNIGIGIIPNCTLLSGVSKMYSEINLIADSPQSTAAINALASNFTSGYLNTVTLSNFSTATPIAWAVPALNSFQMTAQLTPNTIYIIRNITIYVELGLLLEVVPYQLVLYNPLDLNLTLNTLLTNITYKGVTVAVADDYGCNITIPPHQSFKTQYLSAKIEFQNLPSLITSTSSTVFAGICVGVIGALDQFPIDIRYCQPSVAISLQPCSIEIPGCPGYKS